MSKYHIITFGCQMNKSDSERVASLLESSGMEEVGSPKDADFILLNSCSVRQSAEDRIFGQIHNFAKLRKNKPNLVLGVTGCMAGRDQDGELRQKLPDVDLFFPIDDIVHLPRWLAEFGLIESAAETVQDYLKIEPKYKTGRQAYVSIQTGCNNFCTYCVVPYARGMERNRSVVDILNEIHNLADRGVIEITLLGQTVNSYSNPNGAEGYSAANPYKDHFAALLWEINQVPGIQRIHYTAPYPNSMTKEVIDALSLPKHVRYLHLPVQSGSDEMLRKMNRKYSRDEYLDIIRRIKEQVPGIALGTDIIVGFCGESEKMFTDTVSLYKEVGFDISYTAQYSPRTGTPAWHAFKDDVGKKEKKRRWKELHELMEQITWRKNQSYIGKTVYVLVETCSQGMCKGYSEHMKLVSFVGTDSQVGTIVPVRISEAYTWILNGVAESGSSPNLR